MANLKDISRHLGISVTQVSRALNGHSDVSEKTKERVQAAAKKLGYSVNLSARSLVTGQSGLVCVIKPGGLAGPEDVASLETISGLSLEFLERDLQLAVQIISPDADPLPAYRKAVASGSFDGFVLLGMQGDDVRVPLLQDLGVHFVGHGRAQSDAKHPYFDIDNHAVALAQVEHLTALGHRRIALINGPDGYAYSAYRLEGYQEGLAKAGIAFDPSLVVSGRMTEGLGMIVTARLFTDPDTSPTALICGDVPVAKGAYAALGAMNLDIPKDVSVVAHDDVLMNLRASAFYPSLTVTRSAFRNSWAPLVTILRSLIAGDTSVAQQVVDKSEFIVRASTGPAPKSKL